MMSLSAGQHFPIVSLWKTKGQVTQVFGPICPKIELIQDFMAVLIVSLMKI